MLTLLLDTVPKFEGTWMECLSEIARYRMVFEKVGLHEREPWDGIARYWYDKATDRVLGLGRIQHHLAAPTGTKIKIALQLFHKTKPLISLFLYALDSIPSLTAPGYIAI